MGTPSSIVSTMNAAKAIQLPNRGNTASHPATMPSQNTAQDSSTAAIARYPCPVLFNAVHRKAKSSNIIAASSKIILDARYAEFPERAVSATSTAVQVVSSKISISHDAEAVAAVAVTAICLCSKANVIKPGSTSTPSTINAGDIQ